jgi:hypothetical protein
VVGRIATIISCSARIALVGNLPGNGLGLLLSRVAPPGHVGEPLA